MWINRFILLLWGTPFFVLCLGSGTIEPKLQTRIQNGGTANIFISFGPTTPTLNSPTLQRSGMSPSEKASLVRNSLSNLANTDQAGVINMLKAQRSSQLKFETMWASNRLYIKNANLQLIQQISASPNVTRITEEQTSIINDKVHEQLISNLGGPDNGPKDYTYGLKIIQAPEAWQVLGGPEKAGEGVVVGVCDTGCNVEHEALKDNFVGGDHAYFAPNPDATTEGEGLDLPLHGTHVTGTICGKKGIGVAPAAKHVQCQGCLNSLCSEFGIEKCIQFFICPTKADGSDPDCSKRVHIINMSLQNIYAEESLSAARAAGIILVSVAGNFGPLCRSHTYPGWSEHVIATGSTDEFDSLSIFSGLGPMRLPPMGPVGRIKPDVVAPGSNVLSANHDPSQFKYIMLDGTSMAAPHVTGVVALLLTRDKTLTQDQVLNLLIQNTDQNVTLMYTKWCDGDKIPEGTIPNSMFGYGRMNALKTINAQTAMLAGKK